MRAAAPVRICDNGGWTDTWFARHGCVFNLAVMPCVEVDVQLTPAPDATSTRSMPVTVHAQNFGPAYVREPYATASQAAGSQAATSQAEGSEEAASQAAGAQARGAQAAARHPLIDAALDAVFEAHPLPPALACHVCVYSDAPPGASIGSSASTTVALLGALMRALPQALTLVSRATPNAESGRVDIGRAKGAKRDEAGAPDAAADLAAVALDAAAALDAGAGLDPAAIAAAAHRVETERLGRQSGVQDQLAAAFGGACFIEIDAYPHARVTALPLADDLRAELDARLSLIVHGRAHESSAIHDRVIADLADRGPDAPPLRALRRAARDARDAFIARDLTALGRAFQDNTDAQAALHPDLVSAEARRIIDAARAHGALGWKVNGAGGEGGSIAILGGPSLAATRAMRRAIVADHPSCRVVPIRISVSGLRVWDAI